MASSFTDVTEDKPASGLPSLRSRTPDGVEPPRRGFWLFFVDTKNADCKNNLPRLRFVAIFHK